VTVSPETSAVSVAHALGLRVVGVPVGDNGVRVDAVAGLRADLLILTPSHQWPTGGVLSPQARAEVLAWAQRTGALVLEDGYDAEYRYDRAPIGAMQGLDPGRVAYAGTASKTLAPGFRLGWLILPRELVEPFAEAKLTADRGSPILDQLTFADFLARGEFDRHLRRMRPVYRSRRDALLRALAQHLPDLEPAGIAAGLHLVRRRLAPGPSRFQPHEAGLTIACTACGMEGGESARATAVGTEIFIRAGSHGPKRPA
jgi:GntR family transcriptional regulator / MocR family aminotransferase